jgi:hypothetical protein
LPVLGTDVTFAGHRIAGERVVAVDHTEAGEHAVVEPDQTDDSVWHRAHRHHRAHRQRAGAEIRARRPPGEVAVQQCLDVGQAHDGVGVSTGLREHVVELALDLAGLPKVGVGHGGQQGDAGGKCVEPLTEWPCPRE